MPLNINLFGRRTAKPDDCQDEQAMLAEIADSKEMLTKREAHLQRKLQNEVQDALEHKKAGRKEMALGCLKRKKMMEQELTSIFEQMLKLDTQEHMLHSLKFSAATLATERRATAAIRARIAAMGGADALDEHRAKTEETLEEAYELLGIAAQPVANPALGALDDDELLAELDAMEHAADAEEEDRLNAELTRVDVGSSSAEPYLALPRAPTAGPARTPQQEREERELAELEQLAASMGIAVEKPMPMLGKAHPLARRLDAPPVVQEPMSMLGMAPRLVCAM